MRAQQIDPRDVSTEIADPTYRVYFWDDTGASDEWELAEADLDEVLVWIPEHSRGRAHSLWAVHRASGDVAIIRLRGIDADVVEPGHMPAWAREARA